MQYAKKIYFIDNVFITAISTKFPHNFGRLYENVVAVELKRREEDYYYWKNVEKEEVDFVIKGGSKVNQLIQVCYDLADSDTKKREVRALLKASKSLKCRDLLIINQDYFGEENLVWFGIKRKVKFIPLWKWLLSDTKKLQ